MPKFHKTPPPAPEPVQKYERAYRLSTGRIMLNNFLGGISWAIGSVIGLAILFAVLGYIASHVNIVPYIGNFIADILKYLQTNRGIR